jgi:ubiquinone/menaquinone biosynthesis C-methylase UbiE
VQIAYLGDALDSSTERLRQWALRDADRSLNRLELFMSRQRPNPPERFDQEYFQGDWREVPYTLEARRAAEGEHIDRLQELFLGERILDVGCGPGFLVTLMKERGMDACGIDPSEHVLSLTSDPSVLWGPVTDVPDRSFDVVISREVLEHLTVHDIAVMVHHLFRVSRKYVYITTRFNEESLFDAGTEYEVDTTHISLLTQPFLRSLCVLNGGKRRRDLETTLDHQGKGRVLVYEVH